MTMDEFEFRTDGRLVFNQSLVTKSLTTPALCSRLKELHEELSKMDQQTVVKDSLQQVKKELFTLVSHKDRYVKVLVACCISDVLRLYAPDAPFNNSQIKAIFSLFFKQLHYVGDPTNNYFSNYFYLLDSMSTIKSVVLLADLNADDLIVNAFKDFYDIIKPSMTQTVQVCLRDILHQLIEELQYLPQQVVDIVISHFSVKKQKANPAAFRLSCDLCTLLEDKFQRYVCQYFSDSIIASSKDLEDDMNLEEFKKSHSLILQIFEHVPTLLLNVIPQLEEELKVENTTIRQIAFTTLGEMFVKRGSKWMDTYPNVWRGWCERRHDKATVIRASWSEYCALILTNHPDMIKHIEDQLASKFADPDEKVRLTVINSVQHVVKDHPDLFQQDTLKVLADRCRDKKGSVRLAAVEVLGKVFGNVMKNAADDGDLNVDAYAWIPGIILEVAYLDDPETTILMEKVFLDYLVPANPDHELRTMRLLQVISHLTERQLNVFKSIVNRQAVTIKTFQIFLEHSAKYNGGVMDSGEEETTRVLNQIISFMSLKLPDPKKAETQLMKFAQMNEARLYKLFRSIMDPTSDFKTVVKYNKEIVARLGKQTALMDILNIFIRRISLYLINKDTVEVLLGLVKDGSRPSDETTKEVAVLAEQLIKDISRLFPALYKTQLEKLTEIIMNETNDGYVEDALEAFAKYVKAFPENAPSDDKTVNRLLSIVKNGTAKQVKYSTIILAKGEKYALLADFLQDIIVDLSTTDFGILVKRFSFLKSLAYYANDVYTKHDTKLIGFIINEVLMKNTTIATEEDEDWVPFEELEDEGQAKVIGLKILLKPLMILEDGSTSRVTFASSLMKLFRTLLVADGELLQEQNTPPSTKTHLRLQAGLACLKLLGIPAYSDVFEPLDFCKIGLLIQDPVYHVRFTFIQQLCHDIGIKKVAPKYSIWLLLAAHEPEVDLKQKVKHFLVRRAKFLRQDSESKTLLEHHFVDFAHVLAHHPDFSMEYEDLQTFEVYLKFYLETIATSENISYLYYAGAQLKMVRDRHSKDSINLYVISEMMQVLIREYCASNNWILQTYPGKVGLSRELFEKLPPEESSVVMKTIYLEAQSDFMKHRMHQKTRTPKSKAQKRMSPMKSDEETDSDMTQTDGTPIKKKKTFRKRKESPVDIDTPMRRSERTKKSIRSNLEEMDSE